MDAHRYPIGTRFMSRGKHPYECVVTDQLTTRNAAGDVVALRYVAQHRFMGQVITDSDVVGATIAMGLIAPPMPDMTYGCDQHFYGGNCRTCGR